MGRNRSIEAPGVGCDEGEPALRGAALGVGLLHEVFVGARQAREVVERLQ